MEGLKGHKRTGWILDLRAAEEALPASCDFGLELLHSDDLRADGSYLVVVVGTALWRDVRGVAGDLARPPQPPDSVTLFQKFLQSAKLANPEAWAADTRIGEQLSGLLPGQVRAWAKTFVRTESEYRVATGHSTAPGSKGFDAVIKAASNAVAGWMDVLTNWHSHPGRTSYDRNYLLLAAVYDGEPVDSIHEKIASLSRALGEKNDEVQRLSGQQGPGLIQLANQAESEVLPDGRLRFPGPGFAEAVVRYFLLDRPELIERFTTWTAQLCVDLPAPKAEKVAERLSPWILHHVQVARSMRVLLGVAASWSADKTLRKHAHALLVTAALDPEVGQLTRNATSKWIEKENAPLLQTLAQVFQSVTPAHPVQMIRRLGDLAGSLDRRERLDAKEKLDVANAVGAAIDALWEDDKLRPQLRKTLNSWFTSGHEGQRQAAASAFMYLAMQQEGASGTPTLLCGAESSVEDWVVSGWRIALEVEEPTSLTRQACAAWLDTATARPSASDRILSVLVRAVHDTPTDHLRGQRFLNLVRIAEYWLERGEVGNRQDRNRFRSVLMQRAQQADPHQPRVHDEAETSGV
ncbi:hypothetical protein ACOKM5_35230 [Streptomyces sp. BH097]|uniref:hypothetical protein n=1 Tax=unclassified Streptomyces TaxID=2593676 RepID=UPI003BB51DBB